MSTQDPKPNVEFITEGDNTVALVEDEAYNLSNGEVKIHETDEETLILITPDDYYHAELDEDGWVIVNENVPEPVLEKLDEADHRYADAEAYGFPIELKVGFRSDEAIYNTAWQKEALRPSMDITKQIDGAISEPSLHLQIEADGSITVTDVSIWPKNSNVTIDI